MTDNNVTDESQIQDAVYSLAASPDFAPAERGLCFAARPTGLYRSDDGGQSWQDAYASLTLDAPLTTAAVTLSPNFKADQGVFAGVAGGILRSFDGGRSWNIVSFPSPPPFVLTIAASPNFERDGILLAGTMEDGVFRSADRGATWAAWNFGLLDLNVLCLAISPDFANDETLFAGTDSGIFRSANGGRAWREVAFSPDLAPVLSLAISPEYAVDGILFAGTESGGLFRSNDGGQSWTQLGKERITAPVNSILLSPKFSTKAEILALAGDALLISRDGGQSWADWKADLAFETDLTAVIAPQGLGLDAPLLVGLADGRVLSI